MAHEQQHDDQGSDVPSAGPRCRHDDDSPATAADPDPSGTDTLDRTDPPRVGADGQLDSVSDEVEPEPEVVQAVTREVVRELRTVWRSWRGPIPPASELQAYEDVVSGSAERILRMSEKALDSQIEVDGTLAHGDVASVKRGQWQSTAVVAGSVVCAFVTALAGVPWEV